MLSWKILKISEFNLNNIKFQIIILFIGRAICGVTYLPHEKEELPDCVVFKISRKGNFVKSKTLINVEQINQHFNSHKKDRLTSKL